MCGTWPKGVSPTNSSFNPLSFPNTLRNPPIIYNSFLTLFVQQFISLSFFLSFFPSLSLSISLSLSFISIPFCFSFRKGEGDFVWKCRCVIIDTCRPYTHTHPHTHTPTHTHIHTLTHRGGNVEKVTGSHVTSLVSLFLSLFLSFSLHFTWTKTDKKNFFSFWGTFFSFKVEPINNRRHCCCPRQSPGNSF